MKKLLLLVSLFTLSFTNVFADTYEDWEFYVANDSAYIGGYVGDQDVTSVTIPSEVVYEGKTIYVVSLENMFNDNSHIKSVIFPPTIKHVTNSFNNCTNLSSIYFNEGLISIGKIVDWCWQDEQGDWCYQTQGDFGCFCNNSNLRYVSFPSTLKQIGASFENCSLVMIALNEGLEYISGFAYNNIQELTLPSTLLEILDNSFAGNPFSSVIIPSKVRNISTDPVPTNIGHAQGAFRFKNFLSDGGGVAEINVAVSNPYFTSINGVLFNKNCTKLIFYPQRKEGENYTVIEGVSDVGYAFSSNRKLQNLELSDDIEEIKESAFASCDFKTIKLPKNLKRIGRYAFDYCTQLKSIDLPENIQYIGEHAFSFWCSPNPVVCRNATPPTCAENAFTFGTLFVPSESVELYKNTLPWSKFETIKAIGEEESTIFVSSVNVSCTKISLFKNETSTLTTIVSPTNATNKELTWTTSNPTIATVENGIITAVAVGTATITATTTDGTNLSATCVVTVTGGNSEDTNISGIANTVYIANTEAKVGSQATLSLKMKNSVSAQGFQCDVYLPEGVTFATDEEGFYKTELSTARTTAAKTNYFDVALQSDGALRILCNSTRGYSFSGNDGDVATIAINISESMEDGDYPIIIKAIEISDDQSQSYTQDLVKSTLTIVSYTLGDANGDNKVTVTDFTAVANAILGNAPANYVAKAADVNNDNKVTVSDLTGIANIILYGSISNVSNAKSMVPTSIYAPEVYMPAFSIEPGSSIEVPVYINNGSTLFSAYQLDLNLPEGLSVTDARIAEDRATEHVIQNAMMNNGAYRLLSYSTRGNSFVGNNGAVAMVTISADNIACGNYVGEVNEIELGENGNPHYAKSVQMNISVGDATGVINLSNSNGVQKTYSVSGVETNSLRKGVNIIKYSDGSVKKSIVK